MSKREKIVFLILCACLLLPNLMGTFMASDLLTIGQRLLYLLGAILFYASGLMLLRRRTWLYVASSGFLLSAVEIVHLIINHATTSMLFVFTCIKSEKGEFLELLSTYWFVVVIFFVFWGLFYYCTHQFIRNEYILSRRKRIVGLVVIISFFIVTMIGLKMRPKFRNLFSLHFRDERTAAWVGVEKVCPINMGLNFYHIVSLQWEIHQQELATSAFSFGIQPSEDDVLVVLLLGETSRYDHWQLNGYERPTSPYLMQRKDELVSFDSCYTIANLTTVCVPYLLSRATPQHPRLYMEEKSVVDAFHEAGFETGWIANQSFNNEFLQRIALACDYNVYISDNGQSNCFVDTVLLRPLEQLLASGKKKQMIVLHSLGCHFKYSSRYPDEFQYFTPDMKGMEMRQLLRGMHPDEDGQSRLHPDNLAIMRNLRTILVNSYDNAIRFTDYFIDTVISILDETNRPAALVYVGDHGENLLDDERYMFMHGTFSGSSYEYHVPLFVWTSDAYRQRYPDKIEAMHLNRNKKMSTMNLFHSLLDIASIHYDSLDCNRSIVCPDMQSLPIIYGLDANMHCFEIPVVTPHE